MAVQSEQVAHSGLVGGAETSLHSHTGGGNGATIKAGAITTDGGGTGSVVFTTPFSDVNYAVAFSSDGSADDIIATWSNKTVNGFDVRTNDDGGKAEGSTIVNWIATPYSNP